MGVGWGLMEGDGGGVTVTPQGWEVMGGWWGCWWGSGVMSGGVGGGVDGGGGLMEGDGGGG